MRDTLPSCLTPENEESIQENRKATQKSRKMTTVQLESEISVSKKKVEHHI